MIRFGVKDWKLRYGREATLPYGFLAEPVVRDLVWNHRQVLQDKLNEERAKEWQRRRAKFRYPRRERPILF